MVADDPESFADLNGHLTTGQNEVAPVNSEEAMGQAAHEHDDEKKHQEPKPASDPCPCISHDAAVVLSNAGKEADVGVKAAMVATSPQYAFMAGAAIVEATPAVSTAATQVKAAVDTASISVYVRVTTAVSAATGAIGEAARTTTQRAATLLNSAPGGAPGAFKAAGDFVRAAVSPRSANSRAGYAGAGVRAAYEIIKNLLN
jgi:hypothetical protein